MQNESGKRELSAKQEELNERIYDLHQKRDELECQANLILQNERKDFEQLEHSYRKMEEMKESCSSHDRDILWLVEEKQRLVRNLRLRKEEFETQLRDETQKQSEQIEQELSTVKKEMREMENKDQQYEDRKGGECDE